jgi:hypothetical protein
MASIEKGENSLECKQSLINLDSSHGCIQHVFGAQEVSDAPRGSASGACTRRASHQRRDPRHRYDATGYSPQVYDGYSRPFDLS